MSDERTHYDVIGTEPAASKSEVKSAYQQALNSANASGDTDEAARVRRAWQVLSDPVQRQRYDDTIGFGHRGVATSANVGDGGNGDDGVIDIEAVEVVDELEPEPVDPRALLRAIPDFLEQPTLGRRLAASIIDVVTLVALFLVTTALTVEISGADRGWPALIISVGWYWFLMTVMFLFPTARVGQTLGKRFTYVMTVDRETGNLPSIGQVFRRYMIPMAAILLPQIGPFLALFFGLSYAMGRDQLSLADRIGRTVVVVARYEPTRGGVDQ